MKNSEELDALYARLDDLAAAVERGEISVSTFLTPKEQHFASSYLRPRGINFFTFGGYDGAERRRIYILPEYMDSVTDALGIEEYGFEHGVCCISLSSGGYRTLTHRDYLGAVLGLGVERSVIGDILVYDDREAVIFCDSVMRDFLAGNLTKVASEKVRTGILPLDRVAVPEKRFAEISDTVASPRLDSIVGALCSLSREKAKTAVESGCVEVDYECEERPDRTICAPCTVSVRGHGKYDVLSVNDKTKKGRYRLMAKKYL